MVQEKITFGDKNYKFTWVKDGSISGNNVTQVSGYIFNDDKELLIVKNKNWTIPGGHPEEGETHIETLKRETLEESQVEIGNIEYLGYVESLDIQTNQKNYQLRFVARVKKENSFKGDFETSERAFVKPGKLVDYIPWASGKVFSAEVKDAESRF